MEPVRHVEHGGRRRRRGDPFRRRVRDTRGVRTVAERDDDDDVDGVAPSTSTMPTPLSFSPTRGREIHAADTRRG